MPNFLQRVGKLRGHVENDLSACVYCGMCQRNCLHKAIYVNSKAKSWQYDESACYRCKVCIYVCPRKSLKMAK